MLHNFNYISLSINKVLQCPHRTQEMLDKSQNKKRCWKFRCYRDWIQNILRSLHSVNCSMLTKVICWPRLKSFLKSATEKKKYRSKNDKESPLSNIFENILKARTSKFYSASKLKEHLITSRQGRIMTWVI